MYFLPDFFFFLIFGCIGSSLLRAGFSLVVASGGYSSLRCAGFSWWWLLLLRSMGSSCTGFSSCGTRTQQLWLAGSRAQAQQLWCTGLVALQQVGSSWTRALTCVSCIGRRILNHCATREVPTHFFIEFILTLIKESLIFIYNIKVCNYILLPLLSLLPNI